MVVEMDQQEVVTPGHHWKTDLRNSRWKVNESEI